MTQGERIKELRKSLGLTMEKFGDRLGVNKASVSLWESNSNNVSEAMVKSICREFGVSEAWLREGEGGMLVPTPEDEVEAVAQRFGLGGWERAFLRKYLALTPSQRQQVVDFMKSLGDDMREPEPEIPDLAEMSVDEKVALYRQELEREEKAGGKSGASRKSG